MFVDQGFTQTRKKCNCVSACWWSPFWSRCSFSCPLCFSFSKQKNIKVSWNSVSKSEKERFWKRKMTTQEKTNWKKPLRTISKFFWEQIQKSTSCQILKKKKTIKFVVVFLSLGQTVLWETQTYRLVFSIIPNRKILFDIQFFRLRKY